MALAVRKKREPSENWRSVFFDFLDTRLDKILKEYPVYDQTIVHLISWRQVCRDDELAQDLARIKEAGLIPEEKVRLGIIGDGAPWIWNRCKELFPSAKEILDYYHCSE